MQRDSTIVVTHLSLEAFNDRSFEIVFDVYETIKNSEFTLVKEFLFHFGSDELYESLKYHQKVIYSMLYTGNFQYLQDFVVWKYSVYLHRGLNLDYFLLEYENWIYAVSKYLYSSNASEINEVYQFLINNHTHFVELAKAELDYSSLNPKYKISNDILYHILNGNKDKAKEIIINNISNSKDVFEFIEDVLVPILYKIGVLWQINQISVAKEHLATSIIHEILDEIAIIKQTQNPNKLAVVSVAGDELHNLATKIIAKFLEYSGFKVILFSSTMKQKDIINGIYELKPDLVVFSATLNANLSQLQKIVTELKISKIFKGYIVAGGQALFVHDEPVSLKDVDLQAKNIKDLKQFVITQFEG